MKKFLIIFAIFFLGFFWKGATGKGALVAAILALPVSIAFDQFGGGMPFFHAMGYSFLILSAVIIGVSLMDPESKNNTKGLEIDSSMFKVSRGFAIGAAVVCAILTALYTYFW